MTEIETRRSALTAAADFASIGDHRLALTVLHTALERTPEDPWLVLRVGEQYAHEGQPRVAADWIQHAADLAERLGLELEAHLWRVRAAWLDPEQLDPGARHAQRLVSRNAVEPASELLTLLAVPGRRAGRRARFRWLLTSVVTVRASRSAVLASRIVSAWTELVGRELVFQHLLGVVPPFEHHEEAIEVASRRLNKDGAAGDAVGVLLGLTLPRYFSLLRRQLRRGYSVRAYDPGQPPAAPVLRAPQTIDLDERAEEEVAAANARSLAWQSRPRCHRSHRPRPWQVAPAIEAMPASRLATFPRTQFAKLPEPMRRYVLWTEAQLRRTAKTG